jgi:hypothetical protein
MDRNRKRSQNFRVIAVSCYQPIDVDQPEGEGAIVGITRAGSLHPHLAGDHLRRLIIINRSTTRTIHYMHARTRIRANAQGVEREAVITGLGAVRSPTQTWRKWSSHSHGNIVEEWAVDLRLKHDQHAWPPITTVCALCPSDHGWMDGRVTPGRTRAQLGESAHTCFWLCQLVSLPCAGSTQHSGSCAREEG